MIHPSGFLGKENELGKCFLVFFFFFSGCIFPETVTTLHPLELRGEKESYASLFAGWSRDRSAENPIPQSQTVTVLS